MVKLVSGKGITTKTIIRGISLLVAASIMFGVTSCGKKGKENEQVQTQAPAPTPYQAEYYLTGECGDIGKYIGYISDNSQFIGKKIKVQGGVNEIGSDYVIIGNTTKFRGNLDSDVLTAVSYSQVITLEGEILNIEAGTVYMNNTAIISNLGENIQLKVNDERIDIDSLLVQPDVTSGGAVSDGSTSSSILPASPVPDSKETPVVSSKPAVIQNKTIVIKDRKGLDSIRNNLSGRYELGCDIKIGKDKSWEPISNFEGKLDGHGFSISGVNIVSTSDGSAGLFGSIGNKAEIKNLKLSVRVSSAADTVGGLTGITYGDSVIINNCHVKGNIAGKGDVVGGLAGLVSGTNVQIVNCSVAGNIKGSTITGGLVGRNRSGISIKNCYVTGNIESGSNYTGGLLGINECKDSSVQNCYYFGDIGGGVVTMDNTLQPSRYGGGVAGFTAVDTYYKNCYCNEVKVPYFDTVYATKTKRKYRLYNTFGHSESIDEAVILPGTKFKNKQVYKGFNFRGIWVMDKKINKGLPVLRKQYYLNRVTADKKQGRYKKGIEVKLNSNGYGIKIYYTLNNKIPKPGTKHTKVYRAGSKVKIKKTSILWIQASKSGYKPVYSKYKYQIAKHRRAGSKPKGRMN